MPKNERRNITYVDPLFTRPSNVKDMQQHAPDSSGGMLITGTLGATPNVQVPSSSVPWPTSMQIVEQIMKTQPDGSHTVDVIVRIGDVTGAINYNVRVSLMPLA